MVQAEVERRITAAWDRLTKGQRAVAAFLVEHAHEAAFLGVRDLAEQLEVSTATVVRLAQALGYAGHSELTADLQDDLLRRIGPADRLEATMQQFADAEQDAPSRVLAASLGQEATNLQRTLETLDPAQFDAAVKALVGAGTTYLVGRGLSFVPVDVLAHRLPRFGLRTVTVDRPQASSFVPMTADDVLLIASFRVPPEEELVRLADFAVDRGARTIVLSSTPHSDLARRADVHLQVWTGPPSRMVSMAAPLAVAQALALAVARQRQDDVARHQGAYERLAGHDQTQH